MTRFYMLHTKNFIECGEKSLVFIVLIIILLSPSILQSAAV